MKTFSRILMWICVGLALGALIASMLKDAAPMNHFQEATFAIAAACFFSIESRRE
jgi:hypothetical protein